MCNWAVTEPSDYGFSNQKRKNENFSETEIIISRNKKVEQRGVKSNYFEEDLNFIARNCL